MPDDLERRLRGLADDVEPLVVLAAPTDTRARGTRRKTRARVLGGTAVVGSLAAIAAGITWASAPGTTSTAVQATPAASPSPSCPPNVPPPAAPPTALPTYPPGPTGFPMLPDTKPTITPPAPPVSTSPDDKPPLASPSPHGSEPVPVPFPSSVPSGVRFTACSGGIPSSVRPLHPRALRPSDFPAVGNLAWTGDSSTTTTAWHELFTPMFVCSDKPGTPVGDAPGPASAPIVQSMFGTTATPGQPPGNLVFETVADFASADQAAAVMQRIAATVPNCKKQISNLTVTRLDGGTADLQLWVLDGGPGALVGYQGFAVRGSTVVSVGAMSGADAGRVVTADLLRKALDRATS